MEKSLATERILNDLRKYLKESNELKSQIIEQNKVLIKQNEKLLEQKDNK